MRGDSPSLPGRNPSIGPPLAATSLESPGSVWPCGSSKLLRVRQRPPLSLNRHRSPPSFPSSISNLHLRQLFFFPPVPIRPLLPQSSHSDVAPRPLRSFNPEWILDSAPPWSPLCGCVSTFPHHPGSTTASFTWLLPPSGSSHLRPSLDSSATPTLVFIPSRNHLSGLPSSTPLPLLFYQLPLTLLSMPSSTARIFLCSWNNERPYLRAHPS
jgi:hypothetical protein